VDAARAALDYVIAAQGLPEGSLVTTQELLRFALDTLERNGTPRDIRMAQAVAQRVAAS
jgi:hypothetical protein